MAHHDWLNDFKRFLVMPLADEDDDLLDQVLRGAVAAAQQHTGYIFVDPGADVTEHHDGRGLRDVWVDQPPILSLTSLNDDPNRTFGSGTAIAAGNRIVHSDEGRIELYTATGGIGGGGLWGSIFQDGQSNVKIVYRPGWDTTSTSNIYLQARHWTIYWAAKAYKDAQSQRHGVRATSQADGSVTYYDREMPKEVRDGLNAIALHAYGGRR